MDHVRLAGYLKELSGLDFYCSMHGVTLRSYDIISPTPDTCNLVFEGADNKGNYRIVEISDQKAIEVLDSNIRWQETQLKQVRKFRKTLT